MRHIIAILAVMLALAMILPAIGQKPSDIAPTSSKSANASGTNAAGLTRSIAPTPIDQSALAATPSMASFLSDNWIPSSFVPPVYTALAANKNNYTANSTNVIYDFLGNNWAPSSYRPPTQVALAQNKYGFYANSTPSNYQFLQDTWTPDSQVDVVVIEDGSYTKHKMS